MWGFFKNDKKTKRKNRNLTNASDAQKEAPVAEVVLGGLELPRPPEGGQLLPHGAPVRQSIAGKVLQQRVN